MQTPGPGSYKIKDEAQKTIIVPFKMHKGKPLMELKINGKPAALMIDNGVLWDQVWLFGSPLVEALQLKPIEDMDVGGAGEGDPTAAYTSTDLTMDFGSVVFYEQPVLVSPPAAGFAKMFPGVDGQLCNTFFKHFMVEFDFIGKYILLHRPEHFQYSGDGSVLDMREEESGPHSVPFSFTTLDGETYTDRVDIDFGGIYPLMIALNNKYGFQLPPDAEEIHSYGAQGKATEYRGRIQSFTIGKYRFENPVVNYGDEKISSIHPGNLGVIGQPLFMKFKCIFDYLNYKLYLEPHEKFNTTFE